MENKPFWTPGYVLFLLFLFLLGRYMGIAG